MLDQFHQVFSTLKGAVVLLYSGLFLFRKRVFIPCSCACCFHQDHNPDVYSTDVARHSRLPQTKRNILQSTSNTEHVITGSTVPCTPAHTASQPISLMARDSKPGICESRNPRGGVRLNPLRITPSNLLAKCMFPRFCTVRLCHVKGPGSLERRLPLVLLR